MLTNNRVFIKYILESLNRIFYHRAEQNPRFLRVSRCFKRRSCSSLNRKFDLTHPLNLLISRVKLKLKLLTLLIHYRQRQRIWMLSLGAILHVKRFDIPLLSPLTRSVLRISKNSIWLQDKISVMILVHKFWIAQLLDCSFDEDSSFFLLH